MSTLRTIVSICQALEAPNMLETLAILLAKTVKTSTGERERLKRYWKSEKRTNFLRWSKSLLFESFSNILLKTKRRLTGLYFCQNPLTKFLEITDETSQKSGKEYSFEQILKRLANTLHKLLMLTSLLSSTDIKEAYLEDT